MAPSGNGGKRFFFNTRERALSGDQNRVQNVHDQMLAEILRGLFDASSELDQKAGSVEVFSTGSETPPSATIIAGIRPRPEVGTANLFIEPGSLVIVDKPSPTTDESRLAFVVDPGVQTVGALTLPPGTGGVIRIDVIECQRVETVLETDSRDCFNPATGLFTPVMVDKVTTARLNYRIRQGTPGLGFPGVAAGWLPLAVCSVPSGATTWDDVTLWDVRPLASDRINGPFNTYPSLNYVHRHNVATDLETVVGETRVRGVVDVTYGVYRAGGRLIHPGTTNQYLNIADTNLWASGFTNPNKIWNLYLLYPFGLPRWVQYCPASAGIREPRGQRGIPVVSRWVAQYDGRPNSNIAQTPAWTGLLDSASQNAILVLSGVQDSNGVPAGVVGDGTTLHIVDNPANPIDTLASTTGGWRVIASSSSGNDWSQFSFVDNTTHAPTARAIWVEFLIRLNITTLGRIDFTENSITVGGPNNAYTNVARACSEIGPYQTTYTDTTGLFTFRLVQRVPLPIYESFPAARNFQIRWTHNIGGSATWTVQNREARVLGWDLGP